MHGKFIEARNILLLVVLMLTNSVFTELSMASDEIGTDTVVENDTEEVEETVVYQQSWKNHLTEAERQYLDYFPNAQSEDMIFLSELAVLNNRTLESETEQVVIEEKSDSIELLDDLTTDLSGIDSLGFVDDLQVATPGNLMNEEKLYLGVWADCEYQDTNDDNVIDRLCFVYNRLEKLKLVLYLQHITGDTVTNTIKGRYVWTSDDQKLSIKIYSDENNTYVRLFRTLLSK